ncbi:MAG: hypothetical protein AB1440_12185 [Pseudomonadota bacterium]|jgi:hypothetical protein
MDHVTGTEGGALVGGNLGEHGQGSCFGIVATRISVCGGSIIS